MFREFRSFSVYDHFQVRSLRVSSVLTVLCVRALRSVLPECGPRGSGDGSRSRGLEKLRWWRSVTGTVRIVRRALSQLHGAGCSSLAQGQVYELLLTKKWKPRVRKGDRPTELTIYKHKAKTSIVCSFCVRFRIQHQKTDHLFHYSFTNQTSKNK